MKITNSEFVISNSNYRLCPKDKLPEYAFIGRSNVGKSSLINFLTNRKNLAKTSSKPGKTQLINHFIINQNWFIVDLPGYGYASTSKSKRKEFQNMTEQYLKNRSSLICLFVLIDIKIPPQETDRKFMKYLGKNKIPFVIVFTKSDRISKIQIEKNVKKYKSTMLQDWEEIPETFISSVKNNRGATEILSFIEKYNQIFYST